MNGSKDWRIISWLFGSGLITYDTEANEFHNASYNQEKAGSNRGPTQGVSLIELPYFRQGVLFAIGGYVAKKSLYNPGEYQQGDVDMVRPIPCAFEDFECT